MKTLLMVLCMSFPVILCADDFDPYHLDLSNEEELEIDSRKREVAEQKEEATAIKKPKRPKGTEEPEHYSFKDPSSYEDEEDDENEKDPDIFGVKSQKPQGFLNTGFMFFPIYERVDSSTTAFGLDFAFYFRRHGEHPRSRPNYLRTMFVGGQNQYVQTLVSFNNYWDDERHNLFTSVSYQRREAALYQISSRDPQQLGSYRASDAKFKLLYRQRIVYDAYLGGIYEYENDDMSERSPASEFNDSIFQGLTGGAVSGVGVIFGNMPNEDIFSPGVSFAYSITNMVYLRAFGSKTSFGKHTFDVRKYLQVIKNHSIALQYYMNFLSGTPTYRQLSSIGDIFRAYYSDKYLDYHMIAFRGEYRWTLFDRFAITAFLGAGYHSKAVSKFRLNDYLPSYGAGFRYFLNRDLNVCARLDYFEGRGSRGFMFGIGDQF